MPAGTIEDVEFCLQLLIEQSKTLIKQSHNHTVTLNMPQSDCYKTGLLKHHNIFAWSDVYIVAGKGSD